MSKIEAGFYRGRAIAGSEQYVVSRNGNDQIAIDFDVPSLGRSLTVIFNFSDNAAPYSLEKLRACGWCGDNVLDLAGIASNEVDVSVKYTEFEGKEQMKVDVSTLGGGRIKLDNPMDDKAKRAFAARIKGAAKAVGGPATGAPNGVRTQAASRPMPRSNGPVGPRPDENDANEEGFFDGLP